MKIGFLGLGMMGMPIVDNILTKGEQELYFFARREEVIQKANALGGKQVKSLKELGKACDIIFVLLGNGEQCVECILGDNGILSEMEQGMIVISSTIGVRFMEHIYKSCSEKGIHLIDAPISGGTAKASEGTLTMMLSGEEDAIAVLRPYLQAFCENLYVVGNVPGDSQKIKLLNQLLVGIHMQATAEAFTVAKNIGIDLKMAYDVICKSAGASKMFETRFLSLMEEDYHVRGSVDIIKKDLSLCEEMSDTPLVLGKAAKEIFEDTSEKYDGSEDMCAIVKMYET